MDSIERLAVEWGRNGCTSADAALPGDRSAFCSLADSLCFGAYEDGRQAGCARLITDYAVFGHLADVFVIPKSRGRGIGKALVHAVMTHPEVRA